MLACQVDDEEPNSQKIYIRKNSAPNKSRIAALDNSFSAAVKKVRRGKSC